VLGTAGGTSILAGYPITSYFDLPLQSFNDANHDGIIEPSEITIGKKPVFYGQAYPKTQLTGTSSIYLLRHALRLSAQVDFRGGFTLPDNALFVACLINDCPATLSRGASPRAQAAAQAAQTAFTAGPYYYDGAFTRLREISISYEFPRAISRALGATATNITFAARNVAIWTHFPGGDPEVQTTVGNSAGGAFTNTVGVPENRYLLLRCDLQY
jgi:hypothetical protein